MKKTFRSVLSLALLAISSIAFASTAEMFKPSGINLPGFAAVEQVSPLYNDPGASIALAVVETAVLAAAYVDTKLSMPSELKRTLVDSRSVYVRPMALLEQGVGDKRPAGIQADREAQGRNPQRLTL